MTDIGRMRQSFPTRQYNYRKSALAAFTAPLVFEPGKTHRFILGRDPQPVPLSVEEGRNLLADPLAELVLFSGKPLPQTLRALLARLDEFNGDPQRSVSDQRSFAVADGGQIAWTPDTDDLQRAFRLAVVRKRPGAAQPDLLISASTNLDSDTAFLQVAAWGSARGRFSVLRPARRRLGLGRQFVGCTGTRFPRQGSV